MLFFYPGERIAFFILAALGAALTLLLRTGQTEIVWSVFVLGFAIYGIIMMLGVALRMLGLWQRVSLTLIALGFYPIYSNLLALVGYMFFPLHRPLMDDHLFAIDAALGYDWVGAVTWLAQYPDVAWLLKYVYLSSFPQLLALLLLLGLLGRVDRLHQFVLTGMIAGVLTIGFWAIWPSFGPSAYLQIDQQVIAAAHLLVTPDYGANLMDLAQNGIGRIEKHQMLGTVAFPSFHIVMAFMAAWFARGTWLFWPYLVLNILMVPATLTHGGHHLIDVFGGAVMFAVSYKLGGWAVRTGPQADQRAGREAVA